MFALNVGKYWTERGNKLQSKLLQGLSRQRQHLFLYPSHIRRPLLETLQCVGLLDEEYASGQKGASVLSE